jgi:hypothetical protein
MTCNNFHLPGSEIEACAMNMIAQGEKWIATPEANRNVHLCDMVRADCLFTSARY